MSGGSWNIIIFKKISLFVWILHSIHINLSH